MKRSLLITGCWLLVLCGGLAGSQTAPLRRVALVIGNGSYGKYRLATPREDARAVAAALRELGFEVTLAEDVTQRAWPPLLRAFGERARGSEVGLFYFAGHAAQFGGGNSLVLSDAKFKTAAQLKAASIAVDEVLASLQARVNLVLLDANRGHPLSLKLPRGLAPLRAPANTLIALAAQPGATARDLRGQDHSPYTTALLQHLRTPGLPLPELFDRVRASVAALTKRRQIPWEASALRGEVALMAAPKPPHAAAAVAKPADELADWQAIKNSQNADDFQAYLAKHPQGLYAETARLKLQELTAGAEPTPAPEPAFTPLPTALPEQPKPLPGVSEAEGKEEISAPPTPPPPLGPNPAAAEIQARVEWLFYDACYTQKNEPVCCQLAADLAGRFPRSAYAWQAVKRARDCRITAAWEKFREALQDYYAGAPDVAKLEKLFAAGEAFLRLMPDYPDVVAQLAMAGSNAALPEIYQDREKVKAYAEKALKLFEPTRTPNPETMEQRRWDSFRELILASQNQFLGYYFSLKEGAAAEEQALSYLTKSIQVKGQFDKYLGWRDANNYWLRRGIYEKQWQRLLKQYNALSAAEQTSAPGKALLALANQTWDKLLADSARLIAVARPEFRSLRDIARSQLEPLWKARYGSLAGLEEAIKRYEQDPSAP